MAKTSPMQRTLAALRERGLLPWVVERFIPIKPHGKKIDFLHIIDVIAIDDDKTIGIQVCGSDYAAHYKKITMEYPDNALKWLASPKRELELWGWRKLLKKRGMKAKEWVPRIKVFTREDFIK